MIWKNYVALFIPAWVSRTCLTDEARCSAGSHPALGAPEADRWGTLYYWSLTQMMP